MPIIDNSFEQQSEVWYQARVGNPGASEMDSIITSEGKPSKGRLNYMYRLASEKICGKSDDNFQSQAMINGIELEDEARKYFELIKKVKVKQAGMVYKDKSKLFHASPDGLIRDNAGLEIKVPLGKTQARYLYENKLPTKFFVQIQSSLYICERKYWWFLSYVPLMRPLIIKVERDKKFIATLQRELVKFCAELDALVKKIK